MRLKTTLRQAQDRFVYRDLEMLRWLKYIYQRGNKLKELPAIEHGLTRDKVADALANSRYLYQAASKLNVHLKTLSRIRKKFDL